MVPRKKKFCSYTLNVTCENWFGINNATRELLQWIKPHPVYDRDEFEARHCLQIQSMSFYCLVICLFVTWPSRIRKKIWNAYAQATMAYIWSTINTWKICWLPNHPNKNEQSSKPSGWRVGAGWVDCLNLSNVCYCSVVVFFLAQIQTLNPPPIPQTHSLALCHILVIVLFFEEKKVFTGAGGLFYKAKVHRCALQQSGPRLCSASWWHFPTRTGRVAHPGSERQTERD